MGPFSLSSLARHSSSFVVSLLDNQVDEVVVAASHSPYEALLLVFDVVSQGDAIERYLEAPGRTNSYREDISHTY